MLHSSRSRLENTVCRSLRKAALYAAARVRRRRPGAAAKRFSYYYYRFLTARLASRKERKSGGQAFTQQAGGRRLVRAVGGIPRVQAAMQGLGAVKAVLVQQLGHLRNASQYFCQPSSDPGISSAP